MPVLIPFQPSENNYRLVVPIDGLVYLLDARWNTVDNAWYFDMYEEDESPVMINVKVLLGVRIGRVNAHPFLDTHVISVLDTSSTSTEAGFGDLGGRVQVVVTSAGEVIA